MKNNNARTAIVIWVFAATALIIKHNAWHLIPLTFASIGLWAVLNSVTYGESGEELAGDAYVIWAALFLTAFTEGFVLIFGG